MIWPAPITAGRVPVISQPFGAGHLGCDIMLARVASDPPYSHSDPRGTAGYYVPPGVIVRAPEAGRIVYARPAPNGLRVRLELADGSHLLFLHLARLDVSDVLHGLVLEGEQLGLMGGDPTSADVHHTVHLHFEHRVRADGHPLADGYGTRPIDPAAYLARCSQRA